MLLDDVRQQLKASKKNIRCLELVELMESLGFEVRDGKKGGHKVCTHPHLPDFWSLGVNCGHGKNPEIKPAYITKILHALDAHEADLRAHLGEQSPDT